MTLQAAARQADGRLRVAYVSADFRVHVIAQLTKRLFELHDREHFEIVGISYGPDDGSDLRLRLVHAFDRFHDVSSDTDCRVADLMRDIGIHIAVDLTGHTAFGRSGILALRPAPVQVSYLGFLGTMGANFIDYIIADKIALPSEQQQYYREKIVHLPDCFLVTDDQQEIAPLTLSRRDVGLPEHGFVFCSFNNSYKFQPHVFDVWMRLLRAVDGSVLWLYKANEGMVTNLRDAARKRNIDPCRLIFAERNDLSQHLARHRLADLFLDTTPYNAGATASAALWCGVPVLTMLGQTFIGRIAASMLHSIGLPELATNDLVEYEALALKLATDPALLDSIRAKLSRNRLTHPLFDTDRFRRHLERVYQEMWARHARGERPAPFAVAPASN